MPEALIVRTCGDDPVAYDVEAFIEPRRQLLSGGTLEDFRELQLSGRSEVFGDIAAHFCTYAKAGTLDGAPFVGRGMKALHLVRSPPDRNPSPCRVNPRKACGQAVSAWAAAPRARPLRV